MGSKDARGKRTRHPSTAQRQELAPDESFARHLSALIDTLRLQHGRKELLAALVEDGHHLTTTAINVAEIYSGVRAGEEARTVQLLEALECYEINAAVAEHGGRLRNFWIKEGRAIALPDIIVAAVAMEQGCALLTDNRKRFPMPELRLYPLP